MFSLNLAFNIIAFSCVGYLFNTSTPTNYIINKIAALKISWLNTLLSCLTCSTFYISLIGLLSYHFRLDIAFLGACVSSFLITFLNSFIKFHPITYSKNGTAN